MKCYEIMPESPAYDASVKKFNINEVWKKAVPAINDLIGADAHKCGLKLSTSVLMLEQEPEELKKQFKNGRQCREARAKSEIQKRFAKIVKEYGLYEMWDCDPGRVLGTSWHNGRHT